MLLSELLLFLFVCQWIRAQYRESENRLATDAQSLFTQTENQIRDSLLNRQVTAVMQLKPGTDTALVSTKLLKSNELNTDNKGNKKSIHLYSKRPGNAAIVHQFDSSAPNTIILNPATDNEDRKKSDKILRMALQEVINSLDITDFDVKTDTAWLRKAFTRSVAQRFPGIRVVSKQGGKPSSAFSYRALDALPGSDYLSLYGHQFYLFKEVLPQGIFCLVLLLLSSLTFLLAFLNTRQQNLFARQKDDFISNISHELKTPVATAKIAIEALSRYDAINDPERARRYIGMAGWELNRLDAMISKIMDMTQADHGILVLDLQKIYLPQLLQEITDSLQQVLLQKNMQLQLAINPEGAYVLADPTHLTGTIYNLVDNAIKYGNELVRIDLYREHRQVHLKISDKGPGVPADYREKIFEKFVRVPQENIHNIKGYGLGLSYARYITEAHKGKLRLIAEPGWGAIFDICLPEFPTEDEV